MSISTSVRRRLPWLWFIGEPFTESRIEQWEDIESQGCRGKKTTDDHCCQGPLNLRAARVRECHGDETEACDERGDKHWAKTIGGAMLYRFLHALTPPP